MTARHLVDRATWLAARKAFLAEEKAFTRARERLSAARRALPLVRIGKDYRFQGEQGVESLGDLFGGRSQLIVYHFMFGKNWSEGCPSCSFWADSYDGIAVHLEARDTRLVTVSSAPLERLLAYRARMGWRFPWVSSGGSDFNVDFGVTFAPGDRGSAGGYNYTDGSLQEEMPGISVFLRLDDGGLAHSYSTYGRGLDLVNAAYNLLDLTPKGRDEAGLTYPQAWVRRRDQYGAS
ncbi:MAG: DUF899 domain-containing protein [Rhodospirillales bacterium]